MLVRVILMMETEEEQGRLAKILDKPDVLVNSINSSAGLWETVSGESFDVIILEQTFLGGSASETVASLRTLPDSPEVVILCEKEKPEERAALLGAGCLSVLCKKLPDAVIEEALDAMVLRRLEAIEESIVPLEDFRLPQLSDFVSASPCMQTFMDTVHRVVASDATLLIMGETGVGKERLSRAIHAESPRSAGPFVVVNCAALPEALLESELFGHEEGAFTGASRARRGRFELAHNGSLFLDEIGEMPKHLQVKLLNVLQSREVQRVGAEGAINIDVRVMAATNRNLIEDVEAGNFRRDLYYRLGVVSLTIPPLRERKEDMRRLVGSMLNHFRAELPYYVDKISQEAMEALCRYDWPGNIRELMNVIERAVLLTTDDEISTDDLPESICAPKMMSSTQLPVPVITEERLRVPLPWLGLPLRDAREKLLKEFERAYLTALLKDTSGRVGQTAKRAGIQARSLYDKMKRHGLRKEDFRK